MKTLSSGLLTVFIEATAHLDTMTAAAGHLGVSVSAVSRLVCGITDPVAARALIAKAAGVSEEIAVAMALKAAGFNLADMDDAIERRALDARLKDAKNKGCDDE